MPSEIKVSVSINTKIETAWKTWISETDIKIWNKPSDEWGTSKVEIDFKEKGKFLFRMNMCDSSFGFDHTGTYTKIIKHELIEYAQLDGRKSFVSFEKVNDTILITERFDADDEVSLKEQEDFCKGVLQNFKNHCEKTKRLKLSLRN